LDKYKLLPTIYPTPKFHIISPFIRV
jgi:hypothetical protein